MTRPGPAARARCAEPEHDDPQPKLNIRNDLFYSGTSMKDPDVNVTISPPIDDLVAIVTGALLVAWISAEARGFQKWCIYVNKLQKGYYK